MHVNWHLNGLAYNYDAVILVCVSTQVFQKCASEPVAVVVKAELTFV